MISGLVNTVYKFPTGMLKNSKVYVYDIETIITAKIKKIFL